MEFMGEVESGGVPLVGSVVPDSTPVTEVVVGGWVPSVSNVVNCGVPSRP